MIWKYPDASDNKWVQVDCRPDHASFRNYSFFYNDTKIFFSDWSLNKDKAIYNYIIEHDDTEGWTTVNLYVFIT